MPLSLDELKTHLGEATKEIKQQVEKRDSEVKEIGEATAETRKSLTAATKRMDEIQTEIAAALDNAKKSDERLIEVEKMLKRQLDGADSQTIKSIGQQFVESQVYKSAVERGERSTGTFLAKSIVSTPASAGALVRPDRRPEIYQDPERPLFIRQLLPSVPTDSNAVEIMRENVFTNAAEPQGVAESVNYELKDKKPSNITYELVTVPVRTMAHFIPASRQILSDAPRLQSRIDGRLTYGLNLLSDTQLLYGDGSGQNLTGLMVDPGVSDIGGTAAPGTGESQAGLMLDHLRRAVTRLKLDEYYNINGFVLNPQDYETIELAKGTDGHYIWVNVNNGGVPRLWRVPIIESNAINRGEFLGGDWTMGASIYQREGISIRVSEHHDKMFIQNAVAILAEERLAFGIELPRAFVKGSFEVAES
jgi:HK97 family phage major capsid protein